MMAKAHFSDEQLTRRATKLATYTAGAVLMVLCAFFAYKAQADFQARKLERFRTELIVASAPTAIIMCAEDGTIVDINFAAEKMFGWQKQYLVGQNTTVLIPEEDREAHIKGMTSAAARAHKLAPGNNWMVSKSDMKLRGLTREGPQTIPLTADIRAIKLVDGSVQFITYLREDMAPAQQGVIPLPTLKSQS